MLVLIVLHFPDLSLQHSFFPSWLNFCAFVGLSASLALGLVVCWPVSLLLLCQDKLLEQATEARYENMSHADCGS
jgi:hypothetical protein